MLVFSLLVADVSVVNAATNKPLIVICYRLTGESNYYTPRRWGFNTHVQTMV